ncbi:MAG: BrxA family protein [Eubacterium sp.]|nr:BrxA family protein [Eubacterium sp.]
MVSQVFAFVETKKTAELLTLISIMLTDKLFFEFVHEVYREKIILGEKNDRCVSEQVCSKIRGITGVCFSQS